jgi:hypothetical protein
MAARDLAEEEDEEGGALTELVADLEPEPPSPGVVGLEAGVRHAPASLAADAELRRAGRRDHEREAGEPQAQRSRHGWNALQLALALRLAVLRRSTGARGEETRHECCLRTWTLEVSRGDLTI